MVVPRGTRGGIGEVRASVDDTYARQGRTSALLRVPRLVRTKAVRGKDAENVQ